MTRAELIAALEKATADQQATVLADAIRFARDTGLIDRERAAEAFNWIAYGAYESAALTLVPEGHEWLRKSHLSMTVYRVPDDDKTWVHHIDGAHKLPAIALCIAALKAQGDGA